MSEMTLTKTIFERSRSSVTFKLPNILYHVFPFKDEFQVEEKKISMPEVYQAALDGRVSQFSF